jgi:hypothetical protein
MSSEEPSPKYFSIISGKRVQVDADLADVVAVEQVQQMVEDGPVGDRHHRLRQEVRQRAEPRAAAPQP